jgi:PhzF family phenazine biosynthesis protein
MEPIMIAHVDAFTGAAFAGNPAAVCVLSQMRDVAWMQQVAHEMNLSETAFLVQCVDGFDLRWFTPRVEVDLCGHATLASAHILWENGYLAPGETARFHTRSGLLTAEYREEWIELNFPAQAETSADVPAGLFNALQVTGAYVGKNKLAYLVEVESEEIVRNMQPDLFKLATLPVRAVIVTSRASSPAYDFVSRYFAPRVGVNEDPVTGSAHCCLGPYWSSKLGKSELVGYQASQRGGIVRVRVAGERVYLAGQAVTVFCGTLSPAL